MNRLEKIEKIKKVWEKLIKDNENCKVPSWKAHWKSFTNWSMSKYTDGSELVIVNEKFPDLINSHNIRWTRQHEDTESLIKVTRPKKARGNKKTDG